MKPTKQTVPPVKAANLSSVPVHDLIMELHRRKDEVALIAVTPSDLSDYWGTDDNGNPLPTNQLPSRDAWSNAVRAFNRCMDHGTFTEIMEAMKDAWEKTNETRRKEVSSYLEIPVNDEQKATGKRKGESK